MTVEERLTFKMIFGKPDKHSGKRMTIFNRECKTEKCSAIETEIGTVN